MINHEFCFPLNYQSDFQSESVVLHGNDGVNKFGNGRVLKVEAEKKLQELSPVFYNLPHHIVTPIFDRDIKANCHGYTATGNIGFSLSPEELIAQTVCEEEIAVFVNDGAICHSGKYHQGKLIHYLIGVGVVESTIEEGETAGYEARYNLPEEKCALGMYLNHSDLLDKYERILGYAHDLNMDSGLFKKFNELNEEVERRRFLEHYRSSILHFKEKIKEKQPHLFELL